MYDFVRGGNQNQAFFHPKRYDRRLFTCNRSHFQGGFHVFLFSHFFTNWLKCTQTSLNIHDTGIMSKMVSHQDNVLKLINIYSEPTTVSHSEYTTMSGQNCCPFCPAGEWWLDSFTACVIWAAAGTLDPPASLRQRGLFRGWEWS